MDMIYRDYLHEIKKKIDCDDIEVVSFDVFNTLIIRPLLRSKDVLQIVTRFIEHEKGFSIGDERVKAEQYIGDQGVNIEKIWENIILRNNLSSVLETNEAVKMELWVEQQLSFPRRAGKYLFEYAKDRGKHIIAISDMHLPEEYLKEIMLQNGFDHLDSIYVSCDCGANKRDGSLFDYVLKKEAISNPKKVLHIGDNYQADFISPKELGIHAVLLPSNINMFRKTTCIGNRLTPSRCNLYESLIYGYAINKYMEEVWGYYPQDSLKAYIYLIAFPMLLHADLFLLKHPMIQEKYDTIFFLSRDGHLLYRGYEELRPLFHDEKKVGKYIYASRAACRILVENEIYDRLYADFITESCTLRKFIETTVHDIVLREKILSDMKPDTFNIPVRKESKKCEDVLLRYDSVFQKYYTELRSSTNNYYKNQFGNVGTVLLVDCGFSGTIGNYLSKGLDYKYTIDKFYLWENKKNQAMDRFNGTRTFVAFEQKKGHGVGPVVESTFSKITDSCIGFKKNSDGDIVPVFEEKAKATTEMQSDIKTIQDDTIELVKEFGGAFQWIIDKIEINSFDQLMLFLESFLLMLKDDGAQCFKRIRLFETYSDDDEYTLLSGLIMGAKG